MGTQTTMKLLEHPRFWTLGAAPVFGGYLAFLIAIGEMRFEHILMCGAMVVCSFIPRIRWALALLLPFLIFILVYDALRLITPFAHSVISINVEGPYALEKFLFGIESGGTVLTLNEWFASHTHVVLDLLGAVAYTFFVLPTFALAFWFLFKDRTLLSRYGWGFLCLCLAGFVTFYLYPAAPPWYVELYGLGPADPSVAANPARLGAVDELFGITYHHSVYSRSANAFAAIPSLHAAYPMHAWLYSRKKLPRAHWALGFYWLWVCFSAVYLRHHYVIDLVLGSAYAAGSYFIVEWLWKRRQARDTAATS